MIHNQQNELIQTVRQSQSPLLLCDHSLQVLAYSQSFYKSLGFFNDDIHSLFDSNTLSRIRRSGKTNKPIRCKTKALPFQLQVSINWIGNEADALMLGIVEKNYIHPAVDSIALAYSCMERSQFSLKALSSRFGAFNNEPGQLDMIQSQIDALTRDYEDLHDCMNILTDTLLLERIDTNLNRIIRQTLTRTHDYAQAHNIRIICDMPKTPVLIHCDLKHMVRAIADCLYNILYFSQQDHHIQINITEQTHTCTIEMVNPLFKIPDAGIQNLFTRHTILPQAEDHAGLYFANTILCKHNGKLEFDNSPRYGYKLILTIPKSSITTIQFNDIDDSALSSRIDRYLERSFFDL